LITIISIKKKGKEVKSSRARDRGSGVRDRGGRSGEKKEAEKGRKGEGGKRIVISPPHKRRINAQDSVIRGERKNGGKGGELLSS
jgi:hypothetical protein